MINVQGWAKHPYRTKKTRAELQSTGMSFIVPGGPPQSVYLLLEHTEKSLSLMVEFNAVADVKRVYETLRDFLQRRDEAAFRKE